MPSAGPSNERGEDDGLQPVTTPERPSSCRDSLNRTALLMVRRQGRLAPQRFLDLDMALCKTVASESCVRTPPSTQPFSCLQPLKLLNPSCDLPGPASDDHLPWQPLICKSRLAASHDLSLSQVQPPARRRVGAAPQQAPAALLLATALHGASNMTLYTPGYLLTPSMV